MKSEIAEVQTSDLASPCGLQGQAQRFVKRTDGIKAIQLGRSPQSLHDVLEFIGSTMPYAEHDEERDTHAIIVPTFSQGDLRVNVGDWAIIDELGFFHACKPDIFAATYESADSTPTVSREATPASSSPDEKQDAAALQVPAGLLDALRSQRQIDEDGTEVAVSREAVDVAIRLLAARPAAGSQGEK